MQSRITYQKHGDTMAEVQRFFSGITAGEMPGGEGFAAVETITLTTHNGTHLDAPRHFHPTQDGLDGTPRRAMTIDKVPLEWCFQPGVKLDFIALPDGYLVTAAGKALSDPDCVSRLRYRL